MKGTTFGLYVFIPLFANERHDNMTTIPIPDQPDTTVKVWRDDDPVPTVIVYNDVWGQELHLPVGVARQLAEAILAALD